MSLREKIQQEQRQAMKAKDEQKLSVLRMIWASVRNAEIDKKSELNDEEVLKLISRQVKQSKDALKDFESGNRSDLINKTKKELEFLKSYLPEQMSDEELEKIVKSVIDSIENLSPSDIGTIMGSVMKEVKGQADGNRVKEFVSSFLNKD